MRFVVRWLSAHRKQARAAVTLSAAVAILAALASPLDGCCTDCGRLSRVGAATYTGPATSSSGSSQGAATVTTGQTSAQARSGRTGSSDSQSQQAALPAGAEAVGSAFYINPKGQLLTAWAQVQKCRKIAILADFEFRDAAVVVGNPLNGLAILDSGVPRSTHAFIRTGPVAEGEAIIAFAHPILDGISLPLEAATGVVSSAASPDGVYGVVQSSAVLGDESGGGPIVDDRGDVIGIVVPKMSSGWPDDVTYGISNSLILQFGARAGVEFWERAAAGIGDAGRDADAVPHAGDYTVPVICFR